ncbi:MAG: CZB domain-containing protein [Gemmatimonadales bacterium]
MPLDFDAVIASHRLWKDRIRGSLASGAPLDWRSIEPDDQCDLGRWIAARAEYLHELPEFNFLREQHARFHRVAAGTVRSAADLPADRVDSLFQAGSQYNAASAACVAAIVALRNRLGDSFSVGPGSTPVTPPAAPGAASGQSTP